MGWLRTLMSGTDPRISSYGELARQCLSHPEWPAGVQPKPRSLAALFSKFDRGLELEWLLDRKQAQHALSGVLQCPPSAIEGSVHHGLEDSTAQRRFHLVDCPQARPVELKAEPLPPGLPEGLSAPDSWTRNWWRCTLGPTTNLVARWLQARGLAKVLDEPDWESARGQLTGPAPIFIQLQSPTEEPPELPTQLRVCVVSPTPAPSDWQAEATPPLDEYLPELLEWLEDRLPEEGLFDALEAEKWLLSRVPPELLDRLESVLGLASLLDEVGLKSVQGRGLPLLAKGFVERRLQNASLKGHTDAQGLKDNGFAVLLGIAKRCLTQSGKEFAEAREEQEWLALVPALFQRGADAEWTKLSLARSGRPLTVQELERALSDIPSGATRVLRALIAAELLTSDANGAWRVSPYWLSQTLRSRAEEELLSASAIEWGEALLLPRSASRLYRLLLSQLQKGQTETLDELLDLESSDNPAYVAAVEALVESVGLCVLLGVEFRAAQLTALLAAQNAVSIAFGPLCAPRIGRALDSENSGDGRWALAVWAISEQSASDANALPVSLSPWARPMDALESLLAEALQCLAATDEDWAIPAMLMLTRLAESANGDAIQHHPLFLPGKALAAPNVDNLSALARLRHGFDTLEHLANQQPTGFKGWCEQAWDVWQASDFIECSLFDASAPWADTLWSSARAEHIGELMRRRPTQGLNAPVRDFDASLWMAYLHASSHIPLHAWRAVPDEVVTEGLFTAARLQDESGAKILWSRFTEQVKSQLSQSIDDQDWETAQLLLSSCPNRLSDVLVAELRPRVQQTDIAHPLVGFARQWFYDQVRGRAPYWRDAYLALAELEARLQRISDALPTSREP